MKKIIKKILGRKGIKVLIKIKSFFIGRYSIKSYSQSGEDAVLSLFLGNIKNGFYVDIGAHHPKRFSNTFMFYKKGWSGINIDPMPGIINLFNTQRKRDITLEIGISEKGGSLDYYMFNESALNGFSSNLFNERHNNKDIYKIVGIKKIKTIPLGDVLDQYLPENKNIDFMSIDVEGLDFEVLKSNNWNKYKPKFLLIEFLDKNIEEVIRDDIYKFLINLNYIFIAKTQLTCIFKLN
jgi:FkbM family methyltransferase